jgi:outer membrane immunogenic protein
MMSKIKIATMMAGAVLLATSATAADLGSPSRRGSIKDGPPPPIEYRAFNWTGFYVGAQIGYAFGDTKSDFGGLANDYSTEGVVGGGHVGYNWQVQNIVFGIETDIEASDINGSGNSSGFAHDTQVDWIGSLRGRLGVAYDRTLFYATAGWAYGDVSINSAAVSYSDIRSGYTVGGGIEHAFSPNMTMRIEYRYTDLGEASASNVFTDTSNVDFHAVRAGVSFKF